MKHYIFVIDTDSYAGNFEREMCAFCTGSIGECGVGKEEKDLFQKYMLERFGPKWDWNGDNPLVDIIEHRVNPKDDSPCRRPTQMWRDPEDKAYNSVAIFMDTLPNKQDIDIIKERAKLFAETQKKHPIKILGFRLIEEKTSFKNIKMAED